MTPQTDFGVELQRIERSIFEVTAMSQQDKSLALAFQHAGEVRASHEAIRRHLDSDAALIDLSDNEIESQKVAAEAKRRAAVRAEDQARRDLETFREKHPPEQLQAQLQALSVEKTALEQARAKSSYRDKLKELLVSAAKTASLQTELNSMYGEAQRTWPKQDVLQPEGFPPFIFSMPDRPYPPSYDGALIELWHGHTLLTAERDFPGILAEALSPEIAGPVAEKVRTDAEKKLPSWYAIHIGWGTERAR
jgi:hypothetical protein